MKRLFACFSWAVIALSLLAAPALAQQPLKIGFGMSLTGPLAGNGKAALISMQIWQEDVNARGGILGRKVELVYYDDQTNSDREMPLHAMCYEREESLHLLTARCFQTHPRAAHGF